MAQSPNELSEGTRWLRLESCPSTNSEAMRLALEGDAGPLWVVADTQTAGRGRDGRTWVSRRGNLHASLAFRSSVALPDAPQISFVCAVALTEAIASHPASGAITEDHALRLKWPNDVLVDGRKVAGILVETTRATGEDHLVCVAGFGVNLLAAPEDIDQPSAALSEFGATIAIDELLDALDKSMCAWLKIWDAGAGFPQVRASWMARSAMHGARVGVRTGQDAFEDGLCQGLAEDGALIVIDSRGRERRIGVGDVVALPIAASTT